MRRLPSPSYLKARASWLIRDRFPHRRVTRVVQGVEMVLPWSHRLPDYTQGDSLYGQNLVELAQLLARDAEPLVVVDVGANVGDSTLQILDVAEGRVVCVEADDYYLEYLRLNVGDRDDCAIEPSLLVPNDTASANVSAVRVGGTARFVEDAEAASTLPSVTPAVLRERYDWLADLRLAKSDTDGYDVVLIPALAEEFQAEKPVLFFEYDLRLSRIAGNDPLAVWDRLAALGYSEVAVWGHGGDALGHAPVSRMAELSARLDEPEQAALRAYWDVAVVHADDAAGLAAITTLVPNSL